MVCVTCGAEAIWDGWDHHLMVMGTRPNGRIMAEADGSAYSSVIAKLVGWVHADGTNDHPAQVVDYPTATLALP